ncbi:MAG: tetraacyldisaccharide 4'-kinase [Gammaproteobacteria bacterium]
MRLRTRLERSLNALWYGERRSAMLLPISWLFRLLVVVRRAMYKSRLLRTKRLDVPVVVIGNITAGGTGKTPLVIWLARRLAEKGIRPGVVSRGHKAKRTRNPLEVISSTDVHFSGDEPLLIARRANCPVFVHRSRARAGMAMLGKYDVEVIICDDGLQHYKLHRDFEIVVVDSKRRFGNGAMLPAGPLREPVSRIKQADFVIVNGGEEKFDGVLTIPMKLIPGMTTEIKTAKRKPLKEFSGQRIHAVAGIGNPGRFFDQLRMTGLDVIEHPFPDHTEYQLDDLFFNDELPIIMTEKDAVKCEVFALPNWWFVPTAAMVPTNMLEPLINELKAIVEGNKREALE